MRKTNASDFKAKCLAILDEVAEAGETYVILKHGKPVARLVPAPPTELGFPQEGLLGSAHTVGDIVSPAVSPETWEANRPAKKARR